MNSLEWINAEIIKWQEILDNFKKQLIRVKGTRNEQTTLNHIEANKLKLQYLHQIKTELEALEIIKDKVEIKRGEVFDHVLRIKQGKGALTHEEFRPLKNLIRVGDK